TYCPIVVDYTTDEAVLAGLLNDYRLVVHRLPLRTARDYVLTTKSGSQFTTSERENYAYWSKRLANAAQDPLPVETLRILRMQALMNYPGKGQHALPGRPADGQACVAQFSEGISIPNLRVGIIWHAFGNERKAAQRIGRLLRLNPDQTATVHLLMYQDTVDEQWVTQALDAFDPTKITYFDAPDYEQFLPAVPAE
nr:hypothetical protein [Tanacetum cinerariifolium]